MGDKYAVLKLAAVQAAPVFLEREATVEKACGLIREAGAKGADVVGFPEGFIPSHSLWFHLFAVDDPVARECSHRLLLNSVKIPSPSTDRLCQAAKEACCDVVIGVCEIAHGSYSTLYNTQLVIGRNGKILGKHQKLVPTGKEKLVHSYGEARTFRTFHTNWGVLGGLMCAENQNNLARHGLLALNEQVHVSSWPTFFGPGNKGRGIPMHELIDFTMRSHSYSGRVYSVNCAGVVDDTLVEALGRKHEALEYLEEQRQQGGGSSIIHPSGRRLAGPLIGEEGILYAEADLAQVATLRLHRDLTGNYNRFDIFRLTLDRRTPSPLAVLDGDEEESDDEKLADHPTDEQLHASWSYEESASTTGEESATSTVQKHLRPRAQKRRSG